MSGRGKVNSKKLKISRFSIKEDVYKYERPVDSKRTKEGEDVKKQDLWVEGIYDAMVAGKLKLFVEYVLFESLAETPKEEQELEDNEKPKEVNKQEEEEEEDEEEEEEDEEEEEEDEEEEEEEEEFVVVDRDEFWYEYNTKMFKFLKRALSEHGEYKSESDEVFTNKDGESFNVYLELDECDGVSEMKIRLH
jgi:hypothetical protein